MQFYLKEELRLPAVGALSFVAGVGVGYFVCSKRVKTVEHTTEIDFKNVDEPNPQLALDFARAVSEQAEHPSTPYVVSTKLHGHEIEIKTTPLGEPHDPEPLEETSDVPIDAWNQEEEESERSPDSPYVLHGEEFYAGTNGFAQTCLEYFAADNVLCDENKVPIYNPEKVVGRLEFGRGSGDSDVVYIRNETLKAEYEVTRNHGSYQLEVLGIDIEEEAEEQDIRHSHAILKFRD